MYFVNTFKDTISPQNRCVGYFKSFDDAKRIILNNIGDIYECGYYPYAMIEKIEEGLYSNSRIVTFFKWSSVKNMYIECKVPETFLHLAGFAIG